MKLEKIEPVIKQYKHGLQIATVNCPDMNGLYISITINSGSFDDPNDALGAAHFVEHMVFKGCDKFSRSQTSEMDAARGISRNAATSVERTRFYTHGNVEYFQYMMNSLLHMVFAPTMPEDEFAKEKHVVLTEITDNDDEVFEGVMSNLYKGEVGSVPIAGTVKSVSAIERDDLIKFHQKNYTLANTFILVVGDIDHNTVVEEVEGTLFTEIALSNNYFKKVKHIRRKRKLAAADAVSYVTRDSKTSDKMAIGYKIGSCDQLMERFGLNNPVDLAIATGVVECMMLSGANSYLFKEVREKKGLCYRIFGEIVITMGVLYIYTSTGKTVNLDKIEKIVKKLFAEGWTESHRFINNVETAKGRIINNIKMSCDDPVHLGRFLETFFLYTHSVVRGIDINLALNNVSAKLIVDLLNYIASVPTFTCKQLVKTNEKQN